VGRSPHRRQRNEAIKRENEARRSLKRELTEVEGMISEIDAIAQREGLLQIPEGRPGKNLLANAPKTPVGGTNTPKTINPTQGGMECESEASTRVVVEQKTARDERYQWFKAEKAKILKTHKQAAAEIASPKLAALEREFFRAETARIKSESQKTYDTAVGSLKTHNEHMKTEPERPWTAIFFRASRERWEKKLDDWDRRRENLFAAAKNSLEKAGVEVITDTKTGQSELKGWDEAKRRLTDEYANGEAKKRDFRADRRREVGEIVESAEAEAWKPLRREYEAVDGEIREIREAVKAERWAAMTPEERRDNNMRLAVSYANTENCHMSISPTTDGEVTGKVIALCGKAPEAVAVIKISAWEAALVFVGDDESSEKLVSSREAKITLDVRGGVVANVSKARERDRDRGIGR